MNQLRLLTLFLLLHCAVTAQEVEVKPALPVESTTEVPPPAMSKEQEHELKRNYMLVGTGGAVLGLLLGMAIGRATAKRR